MKRPHEQGQRWLKQAEHQLEVTSGLLGLGFWSDVCFNAEQTALIAQKAFLYGKGRRHVLVHSIHELAMQCTEMDEAFAQAIEWGKILDRYYIPTRYPDALASPTVPFESFTEVDAQSAHGYAESIVQLVRTQSEG